MSKQLPFNVVTFAADKVKVYEQFKDYFNHFHKIGQYDESVSLSEKSEKVKLSTKEEIARLAQVSSIEGVAPETLMTHPNYSWATFAVIGALVDTILPDALITSIGTYTDVRVGGYGDSFKFDIKPRDLFVVSKGGHAKRTNEVHKQYTGTVTIVPEFRDITVQTSLYKVLCGLEEPAELAMKAAKSIETQMTIDAFSAFNTAMGALTNSGDAALRVSGYTQSVLVEYAQKVTTWNGGNKAVVLGTQLAVQNILPTNSNFRYTLDSDYVKIGYIPQAFNYDIMVLPQVANYKTPFKLALDDTKLYIVSPSAQKLIKLCLEGSIMSIPNGVFDNANLTQNTTMKKSWGVGVATNAIAATIELAQ